MPTPNRITNIHGANPYEVGFSLGQNIGSRLAHNIKTYITQRPDPQQPINLDTFQHQALPWLQTLPARFQDEFHGLADGSGVPRQRIAEWAYLEAHLSQGCSSFFCHIEDRIWVAHNNDTFVPHMWGYVTIRNIAKRIPTMCFGLEGDIWATAGINKSQLWLHIDHLPVSDTPQKSKLCLPTYGFLVEALETCETIQEVEALLKKIDRTDGMLLFVADGKTNTSTVFECTCTTATQCPFDSEWMVRTNHACVAPNITKQSHNRPLNSWSRFQRLEFLLNQHTTSPNKNLTTQDLIQFLADDEVERRGESFATAYSTLTCPSTKEIWYTFGGHPSASSGNWKSVFWPW